jgi:hypothetical protein
MSAWAKPGVKCVCVTDRGFDAALKYGMSIPSAGEVYTVREVREWDFGVGLLLSEVVNRPEHWANGVSEAAWQIECFRPLITQEDDVRLIKSLLLEDAGLVPAGVELDA